MNRNEKILIYGALLHDIGKAIHRSENLKSAHPKSGCDFIKDIDVFEDRDVKEKVMEIVKNHHNKDVSEILLDIVKESDRLSAKYDRKEYNGEDKPEITTTPLQCIFSEIEIMGKKPNIMVYNPLKILSTDIESHFPKLKKEATVNRSDYNEIKDRLKEDIMALEKLYERGKIDTLNYILMKNLKFVPSAIYKTVPNIPLYDHLKTTAAIALALYRGDKNRPFLLIGGEISGIQKFIFYNINAQESDDNAAKRFRGRSFFINLFTDSVVRYIMEILDIYEFTVLVNAAGHFLILAPNTEKNREKLDEIRYNVNRYLLENEFPELCMTMAWRECGTDDMENFKELLYKFYTENLAEEKRKKFHELLSGDYGEQFFSEEIHINVCPSCGRKCDECGQEKRCKVCTAIEEIGRRLVNAKYLVRGINKDEGLWTFKYGNFSITYSLERDDVTKDIYKEWEVFDIREVKIPDFGTLKGFRIFGSYAPIHKNKIDRIMNFEEIVTKDYARKEKIPKLAIFKADVDNLGLIFKEGIKDMSISKYSHLSFMLDFFFAVESAKIAEKYNIYLLFAGGDDLSAIGRYDDILKFASEIHEKFVKWCGENPAMSISGGIAMAGVKFPVRRLVQYGENELENAKHKDGEKNKISIFDTPLSWSEFDEQMSLAEELEKYRKEGKIGGVFSHYLIHLHRKNPYVSKVEKEIIIPRPYIVYYIRRNFKTDDSEEREKLIEKREKLIEKIVEHFNHINVGASIWALNRRYFGEQKGGDKNE